MKPWLITTVLLAGCSGQTTLAPGQDPGRAPFRLDAAAAGMERECSLAEGSLLHVTRGGDLELRPTTPTQPTYPQFSCVMAAIEQAKLEKRGVRVILIGEDAAR